MSFQGSVNRFFKECKRVLKVSKKPSKEEYVNFSKVTAIGILIIGVIGFIIVLIFQLIGI
ncbi:protein translocase, subunit SecE [Methanobrevibacter arboriphilus JCM 13429 = DSM 1125]|uniref:Protein translocase subunit SecE n=1 Tax=Methanobrevibacter arboriphilus JCM 13429 = DSM 1125 TaxID=1300164 RepID=A0A1V6N536_METAZ|nr:protein translocase SEC61 complex subunit gamma [Methanobrevibacter arboriphilus]OQD59697.1 protein translocase, subunit SecE [Methanobrevibacter arboriphilus JCM 13429 = DSM 1125]